MTWLRATLTSVLLLAVLGASSADAQPAARVFRIGTLGSYESPMWQGFRQGLRDLGYAPGRNVTIEARWTEGFPDRFPALAGELAASKVDIIVASSMQAIQAAKGATSTIPVVMVLGSFPDKLGLVDSLQRPGGNVTGLTTLTPQLIAKRVELLKEIVPKASRLAVLSDPSNPIEALGLRELISAADTVGLEVHNFPARTPEELPAAVAQAVSGGSDALWAIGNPVNFKSQKLITAAALKNRLPSVYDERTFVDAGGLVSYGPNYTDQFRRAATYVDKILKGAKPAELPVEQPIMFELSINRTTATALGLTIPPAVLLRADRVID